MSVSESNNSDHGQSESCRSELGHMCTNNECPDEDKSILDLMWTRIQSSGAPAVKKQRSRRKTDGDGPTCTLSGVPLSVEYDGASDFLSSVFNTEEGPVLFALLQTLMLGAHYKTLAPSEMLAMLRDKRPDLFVDGNLRLLPMFAKTVSRPRRPPAKTPTSKPSKDALESNDDKEITEVKVEPSLPLQTPVVEKPEDVPSSVVAPLPKDEQRVSASVLRRDDDRPAEGKPQDVSTDIKESGPIPATESKSGTEAKDPEKTEPEPVLVTETKPGAEAKDPEKAEPGPAFSPVVVPQSNVAETDKVQRQVPVASPSSSEKQRRIDELQKQIEALQKAQGRPISPQLASKGKDGVAKKPKVGTGPEDTGANPKPRKRKETEEQRQERQEREEQRRVKQEQKDRERKEREEQRRLKQEQKERERKEREEQRRVKQEEKERKQEEKERKQAEQKRKREEKQHEKASKKKVDNKRKVEDVPAPEKKAKTEPPVAKTAPVEVVPSLHVIHEPKVPGPTFGNNDAIKIIDPSPVPEPLPVAAVVAVPQSGFSASGPAPVPAPTNDVLGSISSIPAQNFEIGGTTQHPGPVPMDTTQDPVLPVLPEAAMPTVPPEALVASTAVPVPEQSRQAQNNLSGLPEANDDIFASFGNVDWE